MVGVIESWLTRVPGMEAWRDSERVWHFQERFGVQKVKTVEKRPGEPYQMMSVEAWKKRRSYPSEEGGIDTERSPPC